MSTGLELPNAPGAWKRKGWIVVINSLFEWYVGFFDDCETKGTIYELPTGDWLPADGTAERAETVEESVSRLIQKRAIHVKKKTVMGEESWEDVFSHMREEVDEAQFEVESRSDQHHENVLEELADIYGVLVHAVIKAGYSMRELEMQELHKLDCRFAIQHADTRQPAERAETLTEINRGGVTHQLLRMAHGAEQFPEHADTSQPTTKQLESNHAPELATADAPAGGLKQTLTAADLPGWYECKLGVDTRVLWWNCETLYECVENHPACEEHRDFRGPLVPQTPDEHQDDELIAAHKALSAAGVVAECEVGSAKGGYLLSLVQRIGILVSELAKAREEIKRLRTELAKWHPVTPEEIEAYRQSLDR